MKKRFIVILAFAAFVFGFLSGTKEGKETFHFAVENWWGFLSERMGEDIQVARVSRHQEIRDAIRQFKVQKVEAAAAQREDLAEQIRLAPESYTPEKRIVLTQVKYPHLTIISQDKDKKRVELGRDEAIMIPRILAALPEDALTAFEQIIIQYGNPPDMRRGMAGGGVMFVKDIASMRGGAEEFTQVFVHEAGHVTDIAYLKGTSGSAETVFKDGQVALLADDPSVEFYSYNWADDKTKRGDADGLNFPSRYGASDAFENFAEVFNAFVSQPEALRTIAGTNSVLKEHYEFIKNRLYGGGEFVAEVDSAQLDKNPRVWDTTVMPMTDRIIDYKL